MKSKKFNYKGTDILVLQDGKQVEFYMNNVTSHYYFCTDYKANIEDITKRDAIRIWNHYSDSVIESDNVLMSYYLGRKKNQ